MKRDRTYSNAIVVMWHMIVVVGVARDMCDSVLYDNLSEGMSYGAHHIPFAQSFDGVDGIHVSCTHYAYSNSNCTYF